jgi:hypothetical protein
VLRALSADGRAVSVSWNVNARCRLGYARHGQVLASLDPLAPQRRRGPVPDALEPYLAGLTFAEDEQAAAQTWAERITGVRLDGDWLGAAMYQCSLPPASRQPAQMCLPRTGMGIRR